MAQPRSAMNAPLLGSALLHGGLAAALLVSWPWLGRTVQMDAAVPVTIVARGPVTNIRPAEQAPVEAEAQVEEPAAEPEPEPPPPPPPPPEPAPQPTPKPKPAPTPTPKPKPKPAEKAPSLDLDALEKSLGATPPQPRPKARPGAARAETSLQARQAAGEATELVGAFLSELGSDLSRRWNPNCEVEGGRDVNIEVRFRLDQGGRLVGGVEASGERSSNPVVKVASDRAKRAVHAAAPFRNLPAQLYDERITVRFDARTACASG